MFFTIYIKKHKLPLISHPNRHTTPTTYNLLFKENVIVCGILAFLTLLSCWGHVDIHLMASLASSTRGY